MNNYLATMVALQALNTVNNYYAEASMVQEMEQYKRYRREAEEQKEQTPLDKFTKGIPVNIEEVLDKLKKGWVCMEPCGLWHYSKTRPFFDKISGGWGSFSGFEDLPDNLSIEPIDDWQMSRMECGK